MYDLVIIGASPEGLTAAKQASHFPHKRTALITQTPPLPQAVDAHTYWQLWPRLLAVNVDNSYFNAPAPISLEPIHARLQALSPSGQQETLGQLALAGIDVIYGNGQFLAVTPLSIAVNDRCLVAKAYLLTSLPAPTTANNLVYLEQIPAFSGELKGDNWAIAGASPLALAWAQILALCGKNVQILSRNDRLLPQEDGEMTHLLQAHLEALGVVFCHNTTVLKVDRAHNDFFLELSTGQSLQVQQYLKASFPPLHCDLLKNLHLVQKQGFLRTNNSLQTSHPQIYACGSWLRGYSLSNLYNREAQWLVEHLWGQSQPLGYENIPLTLATQPSWFRLGYGAAQLAFEPLVYRYEVPDALTGQVQVLKVLVHPQSHRVFSIYGWGQEWRAKMFQDSIRKRWVT
jgi:pyruvate/2-oxoglutarate dehydrogenase complex dihydrolipoamide dehydrogenase (E3) component